MKKNVWILIAGLLIITGCSGSGSGGGENPAPTGTPDKPAQTAVEPITPGKVEVTVYDANSGSRLYSDEYENTKSDQIFKCFYDKRKARYQFIVVGYNPSSKAADIKRFYALMAGDIILNEGKNEFSSSAGNSLISINAKEPSKDQQLYDDMQDWKIAADGCKAYVVKDKNSIEGRLLCSTVTNSLSNYGKDLKLSFSCEITILK